MSFADIKNRTTINGFLDADKAAILAAMQVAYDGSAKARAMFDSWISGKRGQAQFHPFSCSALTPPPNRSCIDAGPTVTLPFGRPRGLASRRSPSAKAISA